MNLERVTISLPKSLVAEIADRIASGHYATTTEWIRHAVREQLSREKSPMERLIERDARLAESLEQARKGQSVRVDVDKFVEEN